MAKDTRSDWAKALGKSKKAPRDSAGVDLKRKIPKPKKTKKG